MSRAYEMYVEITDCAPQRTAAVREAAAAVWPFVWSSEDGPVLCGAGESSLCGGETEAEFSQRLARAVWQANGGSCAVLVTATCLEELPHETFSFDDDDYQEWAAFQPPT